MAVDTNWESERGEVLERGPSWSPPWEADEYEEDIRHTCCLRFIDKYGDTTFNQSQLPVLIEELESFLPKCKYLEARNDLESLTAFIRKAQSDCTYIKFIGD